MVPGANCTSSLSPTFFVVILKTSEAPRRYQVCAFFGSSSADFLKGSTASPSRFALYRLIPKLRHAVAAFGGSSSALLVYLNGIVVTARGVVSFSELEPHQMRVGILLHEVLRSLLEFLDCLLGKFIQLLLERIALVRGRLLQINLRLLLLIDKRVARREVRFEPLHFTFRFFRLLHLLLCLGSLLGDDVLEVEIAFRVFTALHSGLGLEWRLFVIGRREDNKYAVNARAQVKQAKFASAIRLGLLLCTLIAYRSNHHLGPGLPVHIQDCAANRSCLGPGTRWQ